MEDNKYENIISKLEDKQLIYERAIKLKEFITVKKQLAQIDDEMKRRLENNGK